MARAAPGTRMRRSERCTCARSSTCGATARHKMRAIAEEACALVREYKGAYSGEHGDGLVRSEWIEPFFGPRLTRGAGRDQGAASIRKGLMNPGKIVRPAEAWTIAGCSATSPAIARSPAARPRSTGREWGGFAAAVEMCNNNGHCRKFDAGTMCPSFRVTGDEQHLRAAAPIRCGSRFPGSSGARRARIARRCTTRWICASAARAASANVRPASTWRG